MDWSVKVAKSLKNDTSLQRHNFIQIICQIAIALCIATILVSSFLIRGFEKTIEDKIFNFWSHIRISNLTNSINPIGEIPVNIAWQDISTTGIQNITPIVNKGCILKNKEHIEGIILRGLDISKKNNYLLSENLNFDKEKEVPLMLSQHTLDILNTKVGRHIFINILDTIPKTYKAKIINSFETHIEEFDAQIALTDIQFLQKLNKWSTNDYSWIEIQVHAKNDIPIIAESLYSILPDVNVDTIYAIYPQLFDWLALMKKNELIIFMVMLIVAIVNVVSTISIFVIEKTRLIGTLKVLGAKNKSIIKMMYYQVLLIILRGLLWGNLVALIITIIMSYFKPIKLDPSVYYISYAPILLDWKMFFFINFLTFIVCIVSAYLPLKKIANISPIKVVEFR